jgi:cell division protein ZapB
MNPDTFKNFEHKVDRLVELLNRLQSENRSLRQREFNLLRERSKLLEKNELARAKVDSMINRLKSLNTES